MAFVFLSLHQSNNSLINYLYPPNNLYLLKITIHSPKQFNTSQWSGGSTTQLYIFPANATYAERNFELRISTAKVAVEESTFTALPGIDRKLMILEGAITITHKGQYSTKLKPFEVAEFSGDWKTTAVGTCTDFNVMTTGKQQSKLYHIAMDAGSDYTLRPKEKCKNLFLYATSGSIQIQLRNENYILETGNLMVIEDGSGSSITIYSANDFGLVVLEMY
ncbi:Protein Ves [Aequorivita sp. CIP111184]|nr:Protein Ves [Aequorivita sp. CIP111184]